MDSYWIALGSNHQGKGVVLMDKGTHKIRVFYKDHAYLSCWSVFIDGWFWCLSEWPEKVEEKRLDFGEITESDFAKTCLFHDEKERTLEQTPSVVLKQIKDMAPGLVVPESKKVIHQLAIPKEEPVAEPVEAKPKRERKAKPAQPQEQAGPVVSLEDW